MWKIIDDNGTIHSGTQEEMNEAFEAMSTVFSESLAEERKISIKEAEDILEKWNSEWTGDLKLIQIHNTYR